MSESRIRRRLRRAHPPETEHLRLDRLEELIDPPAMILAFLWLVMVTIELIDGTSPLFERLGGIIWGIFVVDFLLRLTIAPRKLGFLRRNWLTLLALIVPALRLAHVARITHLLGMSSAARGTAAVSVSASVNRGAGHFLRLRTRRGQTRAILLTIAIMIAALTTLVPLDRPGSGRTGGSGGALRWIATLGTGEWPETMAARMLTPLVALAMLAALGILTAGIMRFFGEHTARPAGTEPAAGDAPEPDRHV